MIPLWVCLQYNSVLLLVVCFFLCYFESNAKAGWPVFSYNFASFIVYDGLSDLSLYRYTQ